MGCSFVQNNDRFGTGYGHRGKTADTVKVASVLEAVIDCNKVPPPPGDVIKSTRCIIGDSIQFSLQGKKVTIAIGDLDFQYHSGVRGNPKLSVEESLFGTHYKVYCRNWEQKMHFFPCLAS